MNESYTPTIISLDEKTAERRAQTHVLRQAGYRVLEASSEAEALSFMHQQPMLVILNSENDERFRTLADSAPALIWMNGPQGCEFLNKAYLDFLGVRDEKVCGYDWADFVHPDDRKGYITAYLEAVVDRRLFEATCRFRRHDGQYRWMKSVGAPRFGPDGAFLGYVGSTIDVTELQSRAVTSSSSTNTLIDRRAALHQRFRTVSIGLASATACIAGLVLVGWACDLTLLTSISSSFMSMKVTTAVGFLCAAGSVLLFTTRRSKSHLGAEKALGIASVTFAVPTVLLGVGTLLGYSAGLAGDATHPGWMAQATAGCFVLLGVGLMFANRQGPVSERLSQYPALLVLCIAGVALVGYLYDKDSLYAVGPYSSMALHTALSFVLLSTALLCGSPDRGLMATLSSGEPGAVLLRRMLPLTVSLLVISGWIRLVGEHQGWFGPHFGLTLLVGLNMVGFGLILWSAARALNRTEAALHESEARLQAILNRAPAAIFIKDAEGRSLFMNEYCAKVLGVDARAANGKTEYELFPRELADQFRANDAHVWHSEKLSVVEEYIPSMEGLRTYLSQKFLLRDPQGMSYALCGIATDITERKGREEQLRASEERFALVHQATGIGTFEWRPDSGQVIWNRAHYTLFGIDPLRPCSFDLWRSAVHPDDLVQTLQAIQSRLDQEEGVMDVAYRIVRPDGSIRWMQGLGRLYPASEHGPRRVVGICMDITDRKQAEAELTRLAAIVASSEDAIVSKDRDGLITSWNHGAERLYGYTAEEAIGQSITMLVPSEFQEEEKNVLSRIPTGRPLGHYETVRRCKDGTRIDVSLTLSPIHIDRGDGASEIARNITANKRVERALRESEARLHAILDRAPAAIYIKDRDGRFMFMNEECAKVMHVDRAKVRGKREYQILPPALANQVRTHDAEVWESGQFRTGEEHVPTLDGLRTYLSQKFLLRDAKNQPYALCGIALDMTDRLQMEQALQESRDRLTSALHAADIGTWRVDLTTGLESRDAALNQLLGLGAVDTTTPVADFFDFVHPEDQALCRAAYHTALQHTHLYDVEHRMIRADGAVRWVRNRGRIMCDMEGKPSIATGAVADITERKQAEEHVRVQGEFLRQELEATQHLHTVSTAAIQSDEVTRVYEHILNAAVAIMRSEYASLQWLDQDRGELQLLGHRGFAATAANFWHWVRPSSKSTCGIALRTHERVIVPDVRQCEWMAETEDLVTYLGTGIQAVQTTPLVSREGQLLGMISTHWSTPHHPTEPELRRFDILARMAADVLARHHAQEQLRQSEARFRTMAQAVPSFLFETDAEGSNIWTSEGWYRFTGQTPEQVSGHGWAEALHPDDRAANIDRWRQCLQDGEPFEAQQRLRRSDGHYAWVIARALPVRDSQGRITRWVGSVTDVNDIVHTQTALRESEERLRLAQQAGQIGVFEWNVQTGINIWTPELETMYGLKPGEFAQTQQAWEAFLYSEDRNEALHGVDEAFASGAPTMREFRIRRPDGTIRWIAGRWQLFKDTQGQPLRLTGVNLDITERKQAEVALRESELRFRSFFENAAVGAAQINAAGQFSQVNNRYCQITGYSREELLEKMGPLDLNHPDDLEADRKRITDFFREGTPYLFYEKRYVHKKGHLVWVRITVAPIRDDHGVVQTTTAIIENITDRHQTETALRESELRFRALIERIGDVFWIGDPKNQKVLFVSRSFADVWGREPEDLYDRFATWLEAIHEDDRARIAENFFEHIYAGTYDVEYRVLRPDGSMRWIRDRGKPLGISDLVAGVAEDITERKQAEEQLRESEERYRATFANAAVGIAHVGLDGRWLRFNEALCEITGFSRDELRHMTFDDVSHPEDLEADWSQARRVLAGEIQTYSMEKRYIRKDQSVMWVGLTVSLMRNDEGTPLHFISVIEDIEERKRAEAALQEAQQRLQRWNEELEQAVNIKTSELQQSQARLWAMASEVNLAEQRKRKRLATELHDHLQQILVFGKLTIGQGKRAVGAHADCQAVLKRVDDILSDALIYSRTLVAELCPPVLYEHGLGVGLRWLGDYMKKHGQTVTVHIPEGDELTLPEDQRVLLFQSVRELLINASKHAGTGEATVVMTVCEDQARIEVRDHGRGFDLAAAAAAAGTPSGGISSKFGLFSIQERMRALGGWFEIQSRPGEGTTATLMLPLEEKPEKPMSTSRSLATDAISSASEHARGPRIRVLLVDDHIMVRQGLRTVLDAYADIDLIAEAGDGEEAVRLVEQWRPDVVVMDINMPRMNGIDATRQIKLRYPETTVIGLSVNAAGENQEAMARAGAVRLMTKDAAVEQLYNAIQDARRHSER
ncbi:MAG: PAS domain S-box protein [Nitrospira sp.]